MKPKDLLRKAYISGRMNGEGISELNFNDFINRNINLIESLEFKSDQEVHTTLATKQVVFFTLKDGKYVDQNGTEISNQVLQVNEHVINQNGGYLILN